MAVLRVRRPGGKHHGMPRPAPLKYAGLGLLLVLGCAGSTRSEESGDGGRSGETTARGGNAARGGTSGSSGAPSAGESGTGAGNGNGVGASGGGSGAAGTASNAGAPSSGAGTGAGATAGAAGAGGSTSAACKRGLAANIAPSAAFAAGVGWWYNWAIQSDAPDTGVEFVPMVWDENSVDAAFPADAAFVLGFNEPNFRVQANLSAEQAAAHWRTLQDRTRAAGLPLVSPAVNYCGPSEADCNGTNPYAYLKAFFAACTGCQVDYVAVHWYNCDLASLRDYLEPGGSLEGFEQFGRPIWLTEFACAIGRDTSVAAQERYLREVIPYLESKPNVFRYSWFSADPVPNAEMINDDGSPNALGRVYIELNGDCRP